ncbi:alpha/beta hydrolase [soil metagenome]
MNARVDYDEFGYFHENAAEYGLAYGRPPLVRRESVHVAHGRTVSALVWGDAAAEMVLIHGGAQNAHTWDTVALALRRPLVAVDLPGHGHSDAASSEPKGLSAPERHARDMAVVVDGLAPGARAVVGMSLGGLTSIALAGQAPELVRSLVLVDITPGVTGAKAKEILDFVNGPARFASFEEMLARTIEFNPTRTESSLRRGILHNALQLDDGSWIWRYRRHDAGMPSELVRDAGAEAGREQPIVPTHLWDTLGAVQVPVMLVRGMREQSVVDDADEAELRRRLPGARIEHVAEAGHSVQGDAPVQLAALLDDFIP